MLSKKKDKYEFVSWGILTGVLECAYVVLVILTLNAINLSGKEIDDALSGGIFMLLLLVISVIISGVLVLGRPVKLVLDKKISEALSTFFVTLVTIFIIFVIVSIIIFA